MLKQDYWHVPNVSFENASHVGHVLCKQCSFKKPEVTVNTGDAQSCVPAF